MANYQDAKSWFLYAIEHSVTLHATLPSVRKRALIETISAAVDGNTAFQLLIETLSGSPYIPDESKAQLAEMAMMGEWDALSKALKCDLANVDNEGGADALDEEALFHRFRQMVVTIFSRSKKVQDGLPDARKRALGNAIFNCISIEQLSELTLQSLQTSQIFDDDARMRIANDMLDCRYDLLLLPDRFDCEDQRRQHWKERESTREQQQMQNQEQEHEQDQDQEGNDQGELDDRGEQGEQSQQQLAENETEEEEDECPVCLGTNDMDTILPCPAQHTLCRTCVTAWASRHGEPFPCPLCRAECRMEECKDKAGEQIPERAVEREPLSTLQTVVGTGLYIGAGLLSSYLDRK